MKITHDTPVSDALSSSSRVKEVFREYGLDCCHCHGRTQDRIRHVIQNNGLDPESFLKDLNS